MARVQWKEGALVNVRLRDGLYTIALLKSNPYMWFFDIHGDDGIWKDIDLNQVRPLFCIMVGRVVLQRLVTSKITEKSVKPPDSLPIPRCWIKPSVNLGPGKAGGFVWRGGSLIQLLQGPDSLKSPVIKPSLDVENDREAIETHELTNMWGDQDLSDRLCRYYDVGINRDDLKFEIFPGLWDDREKLRPLTRRLPVPLR